MTPHACGKGLLKTRCAPVNGICRRCICWRWTTAESDGLQIQGSDSRGMHAGKADSHGSRFVN